MDNVLEKILIDEIELVKCGDLGFDTYEYISRLDLKDVYVFVNYNYGNKSLEIEQLHRPEDKYRGLTKKIVNGFDELLGVNNLKFSSVVEDNTILSLKDLIDEFDVVGSFCLIGRDEKYKSPFLNCFYDLGFKRVNLSKKPNLNSFILSGYRNL